MRKTLLTAAALCLATSTASIPAFAATVPPASPGDARADLPALKAQAIANVDGEAKQIQVMVDELFSYAEPGFQEVRSSAYIAGVLEKNGFTVTRGVAGIPTAFTATWGKGGPLIALGSDIDALLGLSQYPGIAEKKPMVEGAPGHGEGHNSGLPVVVAAAISAKRVMEKNGIPGRLLVWPGVAEELLAGKAYLVRAGVFKGVDASIFTHVSSEFGTSWGDMGQSAMVSVEYTFHGKSAHAAGAPWEGLSALDGVEVMDVAWNFRREHLPLTQRSHSVITNGGGQPNIVPDTASVWYFFREKDFGSVRKLYEIGNTIAQGAALATGTTVDHRLLGYAAPNYGNKPLAEAAYANIQAVGMPKWNADDQAFAHAVQLGSGRETKPLSDSVGVLSTPVTRVGALSGGSDDIGDVMWTVPTITVRYPSNVPGLLAHNSMAAIAMATPVAHKGAVAGAKAVALTVLDLVTTPSLISEAKAWFADVQTKDQKYDPVLAAGDPPPIFLNRQVMRELRPEMEKFYYNPAKYASYLDQLGITYPSGKAKGPSRRAR
jgi:aminobenzoyl-glutamate utilization protein B